MYDSDGCLASILITVAGIAVILLLACAIDWYGCDSKAAAQGLEHQWGPFKGCLIKVDGKWIDYDKWRITE